MKKAIALILVLMTVIVSSLPIGAVQVTITEDFENQTVGSEYTNGSLVTQTEGGSPATPETSIIEEGGNKYLSVHVANNGKLLLYGGGNLDDTYFITGRFRIHYVNTEGNCGFYIVLNKNSIYDQVAFLSSAGYRPSNHISRIYDNKSATYNDVDYAYSLDVWTCFKFERKGADVSIKIWPEGQSEPTEATNSYTMTPSDEGGPAATATPAFRFASFNNADAEIHIDDIVISENDGKSTGYKGVQESAIESGMFNVRFVATVDGLDYDEVGFEITANYNNGGSPATKDLSKSCSQVYNALTGNSEKGIVTYNAGDLGGEYLMALTVTGIPADTGAITFNVKPYSMLGGIKTYGTAYDVVYTNGIFTSQTKKG